MRVDIHNHAIPQSLLDLYREEPRYGVTVTAGHWHGRGHVDFHFSRSFSDPVTKLAELERAGLDGAVLSLSPTDFHYELDSELAAAASRAANAGLAAMAAASPDRLMWMATVPLQDADLAAAILDKAVRDGARGVEVATALPGHRLDEPRFAPFWAAVDRLGVPVMLHPAYNAANLSLDLYYLNNVVGNLLETTVAVERLICAGVLDRHPHVRLLLVHGGGYFPWQAGRLRHAAAVRAELASCPTDPWAYLDHLWFDSITHDAATLALLVSRVGKERVVMGTDLPFDMATPDPMAQLSAAVDGHAATAIAEQNPAELFGLNV
jgi:aminocarboxymuconate-semialdehyde decarboxylase